jgi:hypothetical protein
MYSSPAAATIRFGSQPKSSVDMASLLRPNVTDEGCPARDHRSRVGLAVQGRVGRVWGDGHSARGRNRLRAAGVPSKP